MCVTTNFCMCIIVCRIKGRGNHTLRIFKLVGGFPEVIVAEGLGTCIITDVATGNNFVYLLLQGVSVSTLL